jgi:hypothetical protein
MNYSPDQFLDLIEAVEDDGGVHVSGVHNPRALHYKVPSIEGGKWVDAFTVGCKREANFQIPYDPTEAVTIPVGKKIDRYDVDRPTPDDADAQIERGAGLLTVCAVDDNLGMWPRFMTAPPVEDDD